PQAAIRKINIATGEVNTLAPAFGASMWSDGEFLYTSTASLSGGGEIRRIDLSTGEVMRFAGDLASTLSPVDGFGAQARFPYPQAIWGNDDALFVLDMFLERCTQPGSSCLYPRPGRPVLRRIDLASGYVSTMPTVFPNAGYIGRVMWGDGADLFV